jgi:ABC-2 type transport system ATP-binding protein
VAGHDVATEAKAVRAVIGVTGQFAAVDDLLTGAGDIAPAPSSTSRSPPPTRAS